MNATAGSRRAPFAWLALAFAFALALPGPTARAALGNANCQTIAALPATIDAPGTWCLAADLSFAATNATALTIAADNVTLDCNGHRIDGPGIASAADFSYGIASSNRDNLTVRHCRVRGFLWGMNIGGGRGLVVEDNRMEANGFVGMRVQGDGTIVRRNQVLATGSSPVTASAVGIIVQGSTDAIDNTVDGVVARHLSDGDAQGIQASIFGGPASITGNRVRLIERDGTGSIYGLVLTNSDRVVVRDNDFVGASGGYGLFCVGGVARTRGNTLSGWSIPNSGCPAGSGNVVRP